MDADVPRQTQSPLPLDPMANGSRGATAGDARQIRVVVVAEIRLLRDGLAQALSAENHITIVGATASVQAAAELAIDRPPDVVLLHPTADEGAQAVRVAAARLPESRIVALGVPTADHDVLAYAEAGMAGMVDLEASLRDVIATVGSVAREETLCSPRAAWLLLRRVASLAADRQLASHVTLTERELNVLALVDHGLSNKEIARRLHIQVSTVKNHMHRIIEKLGVRNRAEAAAWARNHEGARLARLAMPASPQFG